MKNLLNKNYIISGCMCSGKDEVALRINGLRVAFADSLRNITKLLRTYQIDLAEQLMQTYFNNPPNDIRQKLIEFSRVRQESRKDRILLQTLGSWARQHESDIWINALKQQLKLENNYVISDCRYLTELESFPDFISIYVEASPEVRKQRLIARDGTYDESWESHPAEAEVRSLKELCDYVVVNNGSFEDLDREVKRVMLEVKNNEQW